MKLYKCALTFRNVHTDCHTHTPLKFLGPLPRTSSVGSASQHQWLVAGAASRSPHLAVLKATLCLFVHLVAVVVNAASLLARPWYLFPYWSSQTGVWVSMRKIDKDDDKKDLTMEGHDWCWGISQQRGGKFYILIGLPQRCSRLAEDTLLVGKNWGTQTLLLHSLPLTWPFTFCHCSPTVSIYSRAHGFFLLPTHRVMTPVFKVLCKYLVSLYKLASPCASALGYVYTASCAKDVPTFAGGFVLSLAQPYLYYHW